VGVSVCRRLRRRHCDVAVSLAIVPRAMAIGVHRALRLRSMVEEPSGSNSKSSRPSVRELFIAWAALALLSLLVYAPHVRHGGFYLDDWANAATTLYPPKGGALDAFSNLTLYRPVLVLYVPLTYFVFG